MEENTSNRARLFFRDVELGLVTEEDGNFPTLYGTFYPAEVTDNSPLRRRLQDYIDYSVAADELLQKDEAAWDQFAAQNEMQYLEFIETDDWYFQYQDAKELILVPVFGQNSEIRWRWNVSSKGSA